MKNYKLKVIVGDNINIYEIKNVKLNTNLQGKYYVFYDKDEEPIAYYPIRYTIITKLR
ncbi:unnamed protein product [marine sediment metagenome]|uniref:Uncharacterized protein n=1 Tax=marine sediment metagenome TaxID=412755 RepID=X1N529_9ZZZZ